MNAEDLIGAFEQHSVDDIRSALDSGVDVGAPIRGKLPIVWLTEMYTRSSAFSRLRPDAARSRRRAGRPRDRAGPSR
jgi:hypothetical protein